ncbi:hypothetical protein QJQ45_000694 [Haematococcus lacustris]|nr:hypothetical protein QJQ45_000694 [Haematococcus lacustris]
MATPVSPTPDTQDPHPPAEARGWTQQHKKKTVSVLDLYNQLNQSNAVRDVPDKTRCKQVHPDDQQLSDKYVALFVATTGTPHAALKNKFLKKAFRVLGATCPRKRVKSLIQDVYLETRRTVESDLSSLFEKDAGFYADMHNEMANKAAQRLLSAHASTATAERNWSMWGHTYHNALRNNFSVEAAKREVYLKANVPTTDSDDDTPAVQDTMTS